MQKTRLGAAYVGKKQTNRSGTETGAFWNQVVVVGCSCGERGDRRQDTTGTDRAERVRLEACCRCDMLCARAKEPEPEKLIR